MPGWFVWLAIFIVSTALSALLARRPKLGDPQPSSLGDFDVPTAQEGRAIPVIFGTVKLRSPNVTWFGDLFTESIWAHTRQDQLIGYRYFLGMQMALCHGPVDSIQDIVIGDRSLNNAFTTLVGTMAPDFPESRPAGSLSVFSLNFPNLFGGEEREGGIGYAARGGATFRFYYGGDDQLDPDDYLDTHFGGSSPSYAGLCYGLCDRLYLGTSNYIKPWAFVLKRIPTPLCLATEVMDINGDANPAEMILEILTNRIWGLGRPRARMDMPSFSTAAYTLASEGSGLSMILDDPQQADQVITDILRHIDGVLYTDPSTGLWTLKLARDDYDINDLQEFGQDDILEAPEFTRGSWSETLNEIKIEYVDRAQGYTKRTVQAQETANFAVQGELASETIPFLGFTTAENAQKAAIRSLKTFSYPLARVRLKLNRKAWSLRIGGVFKLTWAPLEFEGMVLRITAINYGSLENGEITVDAVEDIFAVAHTAYDAPTAGGWTDPVAPPEPPDAQVAIEAPYQMLDTTGAQERIMVGAARGDATSRGYNVYGDEGDGYHRTNRVDFFTPSGLLTAAYLRNTAALDATGFTIDTGRDLESLISTDAAGRDRGDCLLGFDDAGDGSITEICAWTEVEDNGDGTFTFTGIVRGVYDTLPRDHADNVRVWIIRNEAVTLLGDYRALIINTLPPLTDPGDVLGGDGQFHPRIYDLVFSLPGRPRGSYTYPWLIFPEGRTVNFTANFSGASGDALVDATVEKTFTIKKNAAQTTVGTVVYHTDGTVTFTSAGGVAFQVVGPEYWTVVTPTQDTTLDGMMLTIPGRPS